MGGSGSGRRSEALREAQVSDMAKLRAWSNDPNESMRLRSTVVLLLLSGLSVREVCSRVGVNPKTAYGWRTRWNDRGIEGLYTREKATSERLKAGGVHQSLKRKIESLDSTDVGVSELKGLVLQFARDVRRDGPDEKDRAGAKLQLQALQLLERLVGKEDKKNVELPDFMKS